MVFPQRSQTWLSINFWKAALPTSTQPLFQSSNTNSCFFPFLCLTSNYCLINLNLVVSANNPACQATGAHKIEIIVIVSLKNHAELICIKPLHGPPSLSKQNKILTTVCLALRDLAPACPLGLHFRHSPPQTLCSSLTCFILGSQ